MKENIDEEISRVISSEIYEPKEYKVAIEKALYTDEKRLKNPHFYKIIVAICCSLIILSSVAYASYTIIKNVFNNRKGVETAINNNYIMDGLQEYKESNGISVKINNMLIDDYNLDISFNVKFDNGQDLTNVDLLQFEKMIICDEENRILAYRSDKDILEEFINKNGLEMQTEEFNKNYEQSSISTEIRNNQNNQTDLIYNLSLYESKYPKSKELIIYAENLILNEKDIVNGTWQIKQKIEEKFYNRESIEYKTKDDNDNNIFEIKVITYATGTNIDIKIELNEEDKSTSLEQMLDEIEIHAENTNNISKGYFEMLKNKLSSKEAILYELINNIYIENSNGIKFYESKSLNENREILKAEGKNQIIFSDTLDMTIYDCTDEITLHFTYNEKEYTIKLLN